MTEPVALSLNVFQLSRPSCCLLSSKWMRERLFYALYAILNCLVSVQRQWKNPSISLSISTALTCTFHLVHWPHESDLALYCPPRKLQTTPLRLSDLTFLLGMEGLLTDSETQSSDFIWGGGWINSYSRHATIFLFLRNYGFVPLSNSNTVCIHRNNPFRKGQQDRNVRFLQPGLTHFLSYRAPNQPPLNWLTCLTRLSGKPKTNIGASYTEHSWVHIERDGGILRCLPPPQCYTARLSLCIARLALGDLFDGTDKGDLSP